MVQPTQKVNHTCNNCKILIIIINDDNNNSVNDCDNVGNNFTSV